MLLKCQQGLRFVFPEQGPIAAAMDILSDIS